MEFYNLPDKIKTLIFYIDGTLYTSKEYVAEQVDVQVRHWADLNSISHDEGRRRIAEFRAKYEKENNGKKISLGNTFLYFGVDIETSIAWRNKLLQPELYLKKNERLAETLRILKEKFNLICLTNNPVDAARKTLASVGIDKLIPDIIGLDTCRKSKPAKDMLDLACEMTSSKYNQCISIGDRFDIDLALALELGMGGMLVNDADDLCDGIQVLLDHQ